MGSSVLDPYASRVEQQACEPFGSFTGQRALVRRCAQAFLQAQPEFRDRARAPFLVMREGVLIKLLPARRCVWQEFVLLR
jgi:hypothetical protein